MPWASALSSCGTCSWNSATTWGCQWGSWKGHWQVFQPTAPIVVPAFRPASIVRHVSESLGDGWWVQPLAVVTSWCCRERDMAVPAQSCANCRVMSKKSLQTNIPAKMMVVSLGQYVEVACHTVIDNLNSHHQFTCLWRCEEGLEPQNCLSYFLFLIPMQWEATWSNGSRIRASGMGPNWKIRAHYVSIRNTENAFEMPRFFFLKGQKKYFKGLQNAAN